MPRRRSSALNAESVKGALLESGLFGFINQLPYAVATTPDTAPKSIFVSAFRDMPLTADFEYEVEGNEEDFQIGLTALSKIAKTYLGISPKQSSPCLLHAKDVTTTVFDGPCPAGNVGVQVNQLDPVNKSETVWTVDPTTVIFIGRLFRLGIVDLRRTIAIAGSEIKSPCYADVVVGQKIGDVLAGQIDSQKHVRIINGNPLTGKNVRQKILSAPTHLKLQQSLKVMTSMRCSDGYFPAHKSSLLTTVIFHGCAAKTRSTTLMRV